MERLPKLVDYSTPLATIPDGTTNYLVSCTPTNGAIFTQGTTIIVDLNNVPAFLDPASLSFRYKYTAVSNSNTATTVTNSQNCGICGCPAFSPFIRLDILNNSAVIESINNYNSVATMLTNISMGVSDKLGQEYSMGWAGTSGDATMSNQNNTDGIVLQTFAGSASWSAVTVNNYISAPLIGCSLAYAEKLIPLDLCNLRIQLTLDSLSNIGSNLASDAPLSAFTI